MQRAALREVVQLVSRMLCAWPYAPRRPDYIHAIAEAILTFPPEIIERFCDPAHGYARDHDYPPCVAQAVEWCTLRLPRPCPTMRPEPPVDRSCHPTLDELRVRYPDIFPQVGPRQSAAQDFSQDC